MNSSEASMLFRDSLEIERAGQLLTVDGERALFWHQMQMLIVADLHLGKAQHFRSAGIAIPTDVTDHTLMRLDKVLRKYSPTKFLILGDLFHSSRYEELHLLAEFKAAHTGCEWTIIQGNHDRGFQKHASALGMTFIKDYLKYDPFLFHHGNLSMSIDEGTYGISGHIHPCIMLYGKANQRERVPCFHFSEREGVLPAFGEFTGLHPIQPHDDDLIIGISGDQVFWGNRDGPI